MAETKHIGKNISRLRELRTMKQETLAEALGVSQQAVSRMEQNEVVDDMMLERVGKVLGVSPALIKNFDEEKAIYNFQNNYEHSTGYTGPNYNCTFNPLDKLEEANGKIKDLYEKLLKAEQEKVAVMQKLIEKLERLSGG
jgi:transcriptional regulator with XRE-family HTH domain